MVNNLLTRTKGSAGQMAISVGSNVLTPEGREAKVRKIEPIHDGYVGRPPLEATVQLKDRYGRKFIQTRKTYRLAELEVA